MKKILYTNNDGKYLHNVGDSFWAWEEETYGKDVHKFEIESGYTYRYGQYIVNDVDKVNWI